MISNLGRYEIIEELGLGAMGVVYKARDPLIDRIVALKTINLQSLKEAEKKEYEARFIQEAKAAGRLSHPNIITIHDLGETDSIVYIAMELMQGNDLQHKLQAEKILPVDEALNIAIQVTAGLAYAHEHGIVHRDVKPSNIMVLKGGHVKIADFGIARMPSSLALTQTGRIIGSPLYMSPEQILNRSIDNRSDIFSLGILLYQMLTGQMPFTGDTAHSVMFQIVEDKARKASELNPKIPPELDAIIEKCMAKDPLDRYQDATRLENDLRACRDARTIRNAIEETPSLAGIAAEKKMGKWKIAGIALLIILVVVLLELIEEKFFN